MDETQAPQLNLDSADALNYSLDIAGAGARSYAFVIDWHIRLLAALIWIFLSMQLLTVDSIQELFSENNTDYTAGILVILPSAILYFFYHPFLEIFMKGRTPGKRIAEVRLVTPQGNIPGAGSLITRNIFRLIDSLPGVYTLGLIMVIFTDKHIRIGDMAAGTILVYDNKKPGDNLLDIIDQTLNSNIPAKEYEILIELLERWNQLLPDKRIQLGTQFLARIGDDFHAKNVHEMKKHLESVKTSRTEKTT